MIRFYFHHTPNPMKVALFLEETGIPYEVIPVDTFKGEQHTSTFRAINPNGKTPAIVDTEGQSEGPVMVFDSNAILLYLAEKSGQLLGRPADRGQLLSWLMFVATGLGPYSNIARWFAGIDARPAVARARAIAKDVTFKREMDDEARRILFPQNYVPA